MNGAWHGNGLLHHITIPPPLSSAVVILSRKLHTDTMETSSSYVASTPKRSLGGKTSLLCLLAISSRAAAFTSPIFQKTATLQRTAPSKTEGVEIELPDFDEMFGRIMAVSPLARLAIEGGGSGEGGGFAACDETCEYTSLYYYTISTDQHNCSQYLIRDLQSILTFSHLIFSQPQQEQHGRR